MRVFVKQATTFFSFRGSEVHSLLITFSKESIKVKKVSNFRIFVLSVLKISVQRLLSLVTFTVLLPASFRIN